MSEPTFAYASDSREGVVHVINPERKPKPWYDDGGEGMSPYESIARMPVGVTYCGLEIDGYPRVGGKGGATISVFADERLCVRCARLYPGDSVDLFKHPVSEDREEVL